jgi:hypothetical protein
MKFTMMIALLPVLSGMALRRDWPGQSFDRPAFYAVMESGGMRKVNAELAIVKAVPIAEKEAYEGALMMRKAAEPGPPAMRLKYFKSGRAKLESALQKDSTNGEYHFLRLTIQEHVPKILKYSKDLEKDSYYIHTTFKNLSPVVQQAIIGYSKNSKILSPEDFRSNNP